MKLGEYEVDISWTPTGGSIIARFADGSQLFHFDPPQTVNVRIGNFVEVSDDLALDISIERCIAAAERMRTVLA